MRGISETIQWVLTLANTARDLRDTFRPKETKAPEKKEPSTPPQRMPGAFGLSLEDERIFNGVLCQLPVDEQLLITDFLAKKCQDFQRRRFIEVVAGIEVIPGTPEVNKQIWDKKANKPLIVNIPGVKGKDRRQEFLQKLAEILKDQANAFKAFDYVVGARTILKDSPSDMLKKETQELKKMRKASKNKPGAYKGFWRTAISFRREN